MIFKNLYNELLPWWKHFYYNFNDNWIKLSTWRYRVNRWYLWLFEYGFNPKDVWSLNYTLSKWILPRLKKLKEIKQGVPTILFNDNELLIAYEKENGRLIEIDKFNEDDEFKCNKKLWDFAMQKMINSFELSIKDINGDIKYNNIKNYNEQQDEIQLGLRFFAKYFNCLWN